MSGSQVLFSNNAASTLVTGISSSATSALLAPGTGVLFPSPSGSQYFDATFVSASNQAVREIVTVTQMSGDTIAVMVRGREGTTPVAWNAGDYVQGLVTAGALSYVASSAAGALPIVGGGMSGPLLLTLSDTYIAAGIDQPSATLITTQLAIIYTALNGYFRLPLASDLGGIPPGAITVINQDQDNNANVYPPTGGHFNQSGTGIYATISSGGNTTFYPGKTAGQWWF